MTTVGEYKQAAKARALLRAVCRKQLLQLLSDCEIAPLAFNIAARAPSWIQTEVIFLAWARCRWSELQTIDLSRLKRNERWCLTQTKTGTTRWMPRASRRLDSDWARIDPTYPLPGVPYDAARRGIRRIQREMRINLPDRANDGTHIFRHLHASWRRACGASLESIAVELGQSTLGATRQYIHPMDEIMSS